MSDPGTHQLAVDTFIDDILDLFLFGGYNRFQNHDWSAIQCRLEKTLMKLPTKVTLKYICISESDADGKFKLFLMCLSSLVAGFTLHTCKLNDFLYILRACGFSLKMVQINCPIDPSTDILLKNLQNACSDVPSLQDLCISRVRSELPQPVSDEILEETELPKTLYSQIKLNDVMTILKDLKG